MISIFYLNAISSNVVQAFFRMNELFLMQAWHAEARYISASLVTSGVARGGPSGDMMMTASQRFSTRAGFKPILSKWVLHLKRAPCKYRRS